MIGGGLIHLLLSQVGASSKSFLNAFVVSKNSKNSPAAYCDSIISNATRTFQASVKNLLAAEVHFQECYRTNTVAQARLLYPSADLSQLYVLSQDDHESMLVAISQKKLRGTNLEATLEEEMALLEDEGRIQNLGGRGDGVAGRGG